MRLNGNEHQPVYYLMPRAQWAGSKLGVDYLQENLRPGVKGAVPVNLEAEGLLSLDGGEMLAQVLSEDFLNLVEKTGYHMNLPNLRPFTANGTTVFFNFHPHVDEANEIGSPFHFAKWHLTQLLKEKQPAENSEFMSDLFIASDFYNCLRNNAILKDKRVASVAARTCINNEDAFSDWYMTTVPVDAAKVDAYIQQQSWVVQDRV